MYRTSGILMMAGKREPRVAGCLLVMCRASAGSYTMDNLLACLMFFTTSLVNVHSFEKYILITNESFSVLLVHQYDPCCLRSAASSPHEFTSLPHSSGANVPNYTGGMFPWSMPSPVVLIAFVSFAQRKCRAVFTFT